METSYLHGFKPNNLPKNDDKKPLIIALIIGAVLIGAVFTQGAMGDYMERSDAVTAAEERLNTLNQDLASLKQIETNLQKPEIAGDLKRYAGSFREDDILENLFTNTAGATIQSVSLDKGQKTSNGLSMANVQLTVNVSSKETLIAFLDYLTSPTASKRYVIKSLDYPYDSTTPGGSATLSLGMYYYE